MGFNLEKIGLGTSTLTIIGLAIALGIYVNMYKKSAAEVCPTCAICPKAEACPVTSCPKAEACPTCPTCPVLTPLQSTVGTVVSSMKTDAGFDYPGNDLFSTPNVATAENCAGMCALAPNCKMSMYQTTSKQCWLKSAKGAQVVNNTFVSATKP